MHCYSLDSMSCSTDKLLVSLYLSVSVSQCQSLNVSLSLSVGLCHLQQVVETKEAHASEVSLRVVALETNLAPLLGDASTERHVGTQFFPKL